MQGDQKVDELMRQVHELVLALEVAHNEINRLNFQVEALMAEVEDNECLVRKMRVDRDELLMEKHDVPDPNEVTDPDEVLFHSIIRAICSPDPD